MRKKINIAMLTMLLVFQTFIGPLSVFADETTIPEQPPATEESDDTEVGGGAELGAGDETTTTPDSADVTVPQATPLNVGPFAAASMDGDVTLTFVNLITGGKTITNAAEAAGVEPTIGQAVDLNYDFAISGTSDYGVGSDFKFQLPPALLNFSPESLSGTVSLAEGDVEFSYTTVGNTVTLTLIKGEVLDGEEYQGKLNFKAWFDESGAKEGFDQVLEIPILGEDSIEIPFKFKPQINGNKQPLTKKGTPRITNGERFIDWEVWVNESGQELENATITDTLGEGHVLDGAVTIERYPFTLKDGLSNTSDDSKTASSLSDIVLDNGYYAYKLTYTTKVEREATKETEEFTNAATFKNNGSNVATRNIKVDHIYGTKLKKEAITEDKYNAKWEIQYNYFGSKFASKKITDTINGPHVIKDGTVQIFHVTVDTAGNGTKGTLVTPQPTIAITNGGKTLEVELESPNGEAYIIEYETELDDEFYVGPGESVSNSAKYDAEESSDGFRISEGIFTKNRSGINYDKKEITWTLTINAEKPMKDVVITDTITKIDGYTRQTLIEDSFTGLPSGVNPTDIVKDGKGYIDSFTLALGDLSQGRYTITYKTKFDIDANGATYGVYGNTADLDWKGSTDSYHLTKNANYDPGSSPTGKNGYKEGSFDHVEQVFNWKLAVNINKQPINGAILEDTILEGHKLVSGSVKVYKLDLTVSEKGQKAEELITGRTINETDKGFTLKFTENTTDAYIVEYQTEDEDEIIGHSGGGTYGNTAEFTTIDNKTFPFEATATVQHANKLITKDSPSQNSNEETITWTVKVNESHSTLGNPVTLTDKMSTNQLILKDTFEVREIKMNVQGIHSYGDWEQITPTFDEENNSFSLDLDLNQKGWEVRYTTFFTGGPDETFSNKASISYAGATNEAVNEAHQENIKFNFNDSSGAITATKGDLKIKKIGYNPVTGESKVLSNVEFIVYNRAGTVELQRGTTNEEGIVEFDQLRYGYYKLKEVAVDGYKPINTQEIRIFNETNFLTNGGKYYEVVNEADVPGPSCTIFEIEVFNIDGKPITTGDVVLKNIQTSAETTHNVNSGKVTLPANFLAGTYQVTHSTEGILGEVVVKYDTDCKDFVQPAPACDDFIVVVKDANGQIRTDITELTLKQGSIEVKQTPDANGKFVFDSNGKDPVNGVKPGQYDVYEGKQYLGTVTLTYTEACGYEFVITQAPTCPIFTLTVKDIDGKLVTDGTKVTVKKVDGTSVVTDELTVNGEITLGDGTIAGGLEPGEYTVEVGGKEVGKFTTNADCKAEVQPLPACPAFTLSIENEDGPLKAGTKVVIENKATNEQFEATVVTDGKITFATNENGKRYTIEPGEYTVVSYEIEPGKSVSFGEDFTVTYTTDCKDEVKKPRACTQFEITVIGPDGTTPKVNTKVIVEDENGVEKEYTTDGDGKITLPSTQQPGKVVVYEVNPDNSKGERIDEVTVTYTDDCKGTVIKNSCSDFTLTINNKDNQPVGANVKITIKDKAGVTVLTGTTDANGQIKFADKAKLEQDKEYDVYNEADVLLGSIKVSYTDEVCGAVVKVPENACPLFTLEIQNVNGTPRANVSFVVKDATGKTIVTGTTGADGKATVPYTVEPGTYDVFEGATKINSITVKDCAAVVKPNPPVYPPGGGGDGGTPPGTETPEKPTTPPTEKPEPEKPTTPGEETPEPEKPTTPGEETPEPEKPTTPGEETPEPEKPTTPGEETPEPGKPTTPVEKPEKPTSPKVEEVIKKIPNIPGIVPVPPAPGSEDPVRYDVPNIPKIVEELAKDPTKLQQTIKDLEAFIKQYEALSPEEQAYIDELVNMDLVRSLLNELQKAANVLAAANNNQNKLPQTNDAKQTTTMVVGFVLMALGFVLLRRRFMTSEK
ncbi:collagen binding domain-containing protein [Bacillus ndiopicus]|uniref:collagen binding domain-containing protein n=1 Tax=Bacillus ndiopicus TaxID=1347368 RepID=UPI0005A78971|nr:collagen binding domain-containing protein [Bacillus ndiopicus]